MMLALPRRVSLRDEAIFWRSADRTIENTASELPTHRLYVLECISFALATVSVFTALVAFYLFVKMRRSFRQDLIMLLIQSDMFKAFWLMVNPLVYFAVGDNKTNEKFCQVSAFFLTSAIAAADLAVLMIAIHTALYIFRPQRSGGQSGLYPYRRWAYALWFIIPNVLAAVVPLTDGQFENSGTYCYLPVRPTWYRTALSWGPRYVIFGFIAVIYAGVYAFVAYRFRRLEEDQRRASTNSRSSICKPKHKWKRNSRELPVTPVIASHGLLDPAPQSRGGSTLQGRSRSMTSDISSMKLDEPMVPSSPPSNHSRGRPREERPVDWNWANANYVGSTPDCPPHMVPSTESTEPCSPTAIEFVIDAPTSDDASLEPVPMPVPMPPTIPRAVYEPTSSRASNRTVGETSPFWGRRMSLVPTVTNNSTPKCSGFSLFRFNLCAMFQPDRSQVRLGGKNSVASAPISIHLTQSAPEMDALHQSRDKMRRQLRLLFVYPLMYIIMWIAPFVGHVTNADLSEETESFALLTATVVSLCLGAAVDCAFFCTWEKPWRNMRCGFWEGFKMRFWIGGKEHRRRTTGRTREEQNRDARMALNRRTQEHEEREAALAQERLQTSPRRTREWWDAMEEQGNAGEQRCIIFS